MTALAKTFGPAQDVRVFAGADLAIDIVIEDADGQAIDLTGRVFVMAVFNAATEEAVLQRSVTAEGYSCPIAFVGDETRALRETGVVRTLRLQVMEVTDTGTDPLTDGILTVLPSPLTVAPAPASQSGAAPIQIVRVGDRRQVVFRYQGPRGVPGQTPWDAEGQTYDAWKAAQIEAPVATATEAALAAAASTQEIGEQVAQEAAEKIAEVDAAIAAIPEAQEQLQALADILVPSGATATFRDPDNLMLLGDML